jgi:redox-sensitive bicupin YhaK (pirin superfamily)
LSSNNKLAAPRTFWLQSSEVPEWRSNTADRVRVVVGSYKGLSSALVPAEPFTLFDVELQHAINFNLPNAHYTLVYILAGDVVVRADDCAQEVSREHALALHSGGGLVTIEAVHSAHVLILSGAELREPVIVEGPFIMNTRTQIEAAVARFGAGEMGYLAPISEDASAAKAKGAIAR